MKVLYYFFPIHPLLFLFLKGLVMYIHGKVTCMLQFWHGGCGWDPYSRMFTCDSQYFHQNQSLISATTFDTPYHPYTDNVLVYMVPRNNTMYSMWYNLPPLNFNPYIELSPPIDTKYMTQ